MKVLLSLEEELIRLSKIKNLTILIIEDSKIMREKEIETIEEMFPNSKILTPENSNETLAFLDKEKSIDLVLLDGNLNWGTGNETMYGGTFTPWIRTAFPESLIIGISFDTSLGSIMMECADIDHYNSKTDLVEFIQLLKKK